METPWKLLSYRLSPSSQQIGQTLRVEKYERAGPLRYWIVDPGDENNAPAIEIYDLTADGEYHLQTRASGTDQATVTGPVPAAVTPAELVK